MKHITKRNDPCPCGSGKKYKKCCMQKEAGQSSAEASWLDDDGMHFVAKGQPPTAEEQERLTKEYQKNIRNSPMWEIMVREYGEEKAQEMLKEFKVESI